MDEEEFRLIIEDYRLDCQFPQRLFRNEECCEKASWCCWALDELAAYVHMRQKRGMDILRAVNNFSRLMRRYMRLYPRTQRMFFTAADVSDDIADILRCSFTAKNSKKI